MKNIFLNQILTLSLAALLWPHAAAAHGERKHDPNRPISSEEKTFGREGDPKKATRVVNIDMSDRMRFSPGSITIKRGDTVRFNVKNSGKVMHEMVLGTLAELKEHAEQMKKFPDMEHDEPYMAHVKPGATERMVWQFTKAGEFYYGCLVPGHFEAGMMGKIIVK